MSSFPFAAELPSLAESVGVAFPALLKATAVRPGVEPEVADLLQDAADTILSLIGHLAMAATRDKELAASWPEPDPEVPATLETLAGMAAEWQEERDDSHDRHVWLRYDDDDGFRVSPN
jgi:hypothetical protein